MMTVSVILLTAAAIDGAAHVLMAQTPFGGSRSAVEPRMSGIVGVLQLNWRQPLVLISLETSRVESPC
jgi:hypothetical protein